MATLPQGRALTLSQFDRRLNEASRCDLSELTFVDAYGLVGTACALLAAGNRGETPRVLLPQGPTAGHLTRMGFIRFLGAIGLADGVEPPHHPHVVVPLEVVHDVNAAEKISHLLWASVRQHVDPSVLQALNEGLWEMVANALEHSGSEAVIMGQVYREGEPPDDDGRVQVVIGDAGRGIRASLTAGGRQHLSNDVAAIESALEYLVSSVADPGRGQGLTTTLEEVTALDGDLLIRSGSGTLREGAEGRRTHEVPHIDGTVAAMSLPLYPGT